jgi:hypothetical protein
LPITPFIVVARRQEKESVLLSLPVWTLITLSLSLCHCKTKKKSLL